MGETGELTSTNIKRMLQSADLLLREHALLAETLHFPLLIAEQDTDGYVCHRMAIGLRVALDHPFPHGPNILPRDMVQALQKTIPNSTIVETNTLYGGGRQNTADHRKTLEINGWTFCPVDIMDEHGDVNLPVRDGFHLKEVAMGKGIVDYDSMLVLTHFKGHAMGGFGGSMKNIAIGCASGKVGKRQVHGANMNGAPDFGAMPLKDQFMELMADSAQAVINHFGKHITFINVLRNMSVDCDCAGTSAKKPTMKNIGILASNDLLAIDQASCDLIYAAPDGKDVIERIESRHGLRQLSAMAEKKMGNPQYEFIVVK